MRTSCSVDDRCLSPLAQAKLTSEEGCLVVTATAEDSLAVFGEGAAQYRCFMVVSHSSQWQSPSSRFLLAAISHHACRAVPPWIDDARSTEEASSKLIGELHTLAQCIRDAWGNVLRSDLVDSNA